MRILICGDSWGCGEWGWDDDGNYCNLHPGLQHFLEEDGHEVVNRSIPSGHNLFSYEKAKERLAFDDKFDHIIWFKTDPLRDLIPEAYNPIKHDYSSYDDLIKASRDLELQAYSAFDSLRRPIQCIGGAGKLNMQLIESHYNLIPLLPSVTELLLDDYVHPELWASDWIFLIDRQFDIRSVDRLLVEKRRQDQLSEIEAYRNYFWPDGHHPNRRAWKLIYEHVIKGLQK